MQGALQVRAGLSSIVTFAPEGSVRNCTVLSEPGFTETLGGLLETSCFGGGGSCGGSAVSACAVSGLVVCGLVTAGGLGGSCGVVWSGGRDSPTGLGLDGACSCGAAAVLPAGASPVVVVVAESVVATGSFRLNRNF